MSMAEVIASEGIEPTIKDDAALGWPDNLAGLDCLVVFHFSNGKLYQAGYMFTDEHSNENQYIEDFHKIEKILKSKYGEPDPSGHSWRRTLYRDNPEKWGFAISIGDLTYYSSWIEEGTNINHYLNGDQYEIRHLMHYESIELKDEVVKQEEELLKDKF